MGNEDLDQQKQWSFTRLSASGEGGIGIFYLSGSEVDRVMDRIFSPASGTISRSEQTLHYGWLTEDGESVDEVVVRFIEADQSLTGEPAAELNTHSGPAILDRISSLLEELGGTRVDSDAFLERAERHGSLDRLQRQAYESLIEVDTRRGAAMLCNQLNGALRHALEHVLDDLESAQSDTGELNPVLNRIRQLISRGKSGVAMTNPPDLCILGPPNAGKSTLMNTLSQRKTSIVHEVAGTTRDVVHDAVFAFGYPFHVRDTAGLRASGDRIERAGIQKARNSAENADLVLWIGETVEEAQSYPDFISDDNVILIRNKEDLNSNPAYGVTARNEEDVFRISAKEEKGIQPLRSAILHKLGLEEEFPPDAAVPFREEQVEVLDQARTSLQAGDIVKAREMITTLLSTGGGS